MEDPHFKFEDLIVYQKTLLYVDKVYELTKNFPKEEIYSSLTSQLKRASNSIALNIGEGSVGATN